MSIGYQHEGILVCIPGWSVATQCLNKPGCTPSQHAKTVANSIAGKNEWRRFQEAPLYFLKAQWAKLEQQNLPTHLVMFSDLVPALSRYIAEQKFSLHKAFFNCHFEVDAGCRIWVWKRATS